MNVKFVCLALVLWAAAASHPVVLVTSEPHHSLFNSQDLINFIGQQAKTRLVELSESGTDDFNEIKDMLREAGISKERVSSFLTQSHKSFELKNKLLELSTVSQVSASIEQLKSILKEGKEDVVVTMNPQVVPRRLQESNTTNGTSQIFDNMTPAALSGLWVTLFLIVMLLVGINCMLDLKTNDRFARQNLHVGRES